MTNPMNEEEVWEKYKHLLEFSTYPKDLIPMIREIENHARSSALAEVSFGMPSMKFSEKQSDRYVEGYNEARRDVLQKYKSLISSKRGEEGK